LSNIFLKVFSGNVLHGSSLFSKVKEKTGGEEASGASFNVGVNDESVAVNSFFSSAFLADAGTRRKMDDAICGLAARNPDLMASSGWFPPCCSQEKIGRHPGLLFVSRAHWTRSGT
jgi:hypothetical protein